MPPAVVQATSYDDLPYPGLCYTQSHPDRLALCARLLGLEPKDVRHCRVLELGCASGGNLLPMAYGLPESSFVGIDASARQIEEADKAAQATGVRNVSFQAMDLREITPSLGTFDYIIAHGVYSWVAPDVRDRLLAVCHDNLVPGGVAYVSYNTFPGWHMLQGLREMMLYHTRTQTDPYRRAEQARALIGFLYDATADETNSAYGSFLETYRDLLLNQLEDARPHMDALLLHDELEEYNDPVYFWQFAQHAERHGLQYLVEADLPLSMTDNFSDEVIDTLQGICETVIDTEQYMDFIRNRTFRRTLLCGEGVDVDRVLRTARVRDLAVATRAQRMVEEDDAPRPNVAQYSSPDGAIFQTDHPLSIAALDHLADISPQALPFVSLVKVATRRMNEDDPPPEEEIKELAANLLKAFTYSLSLIELHAYVPNFVREVNERPTASPVARYQARLGDRVANMRHERVHLDALSRYILPYLDGTRTRDDLIKLLDALIDRGSLRLRQDSSEQDPQVVRERVHEELESTLDWVARSALLVG